MTVNTKIDFEVQGRKRGEVDEAVAAYEDIVKYLRHACVGGRSKFIVDVAVMKSDVKAEAIVLLQRNGISVTEHNKEGDLLALEVE